MNSRPANSSESSGKLGLARWLIVSCSVYQHQKILFLVRSTILHNYVGNCTKCQDADVISPTLFYKLYWPYTILSFLFGHIPYFSCVSITVTILISDFDT